MRRLIVLLMIVSSCLITVGCGSSSSSPSVPGPLATELSYFPAGSPFMATLATNPHGAAIQNGEGLLGDFPLAKLGITAIESRLESAGLSYQSQVEPLFGNPIAFGALELPTSARLSGSSFLAVWITGSASKLDALIKASPLSADGTTNGATLYRLGPVELAVDGATILVGSSPATVTAALDRHAHGGGMNAADYSKAIGNLPRDALMQAFGSLGDVLSTPSAGSARKIPWVAAIRAYALSLTASSAGVSAHFTVDTSGASLTGSELPIASGTAAPELAGTLPIAIGVRDPVQTIDFTEAVEQSIDPTKYAKFVRRENAAKRKTGYDLNTFASLLTGSLIIESDTRTTMGRAEVSDPASAARQLAKLPEAVRGLFHPVTGIKRLPGGFYSILGAGRPYDLGLVGNEFVAGRATPAQLKAFAAAPATPAPDAQGAVAFRISLLDLLRIVVKKTPSPLVQGILSTLGDMTGSASASTGAVTGDLALALK